MGCPDFDKNTEIPPCELRTGIAKNVTAWLDPYAEYIDSLFMSPELESGRIVFELGIILHGIPFKGRFFSEKDLKQWLKKQYPDRSK